jgi:hypothetical protein
VKYALEPKAPLKGFQETRDNGALAGPVWSHGGDEHSRRLEDAPNRAQAFGRQESNQLEWPARHAQPPELCPRPAELLLDGPGGACLDCSRSPTTAKKFCGNLFGCGQSKLLNQASQSIRLSDRGLALPGLLHQQIAELVLRGRSPKFIVPTAPGNHFCTV